MRRRSCFPPAVLAIAGAFAVGQVSIARAQPRAEDPDEPGRGVARISVINGDVSVRRGDSGDWVAGAINSPLVVEDSISTGPGSRAEVQLDYANFFRLSGDTEVRFSELEYRRYQMQVVRGTVEYRVLRDSDAQAELSTPAVSVHPQKKGVYRVTVREDGQAEITVRSGEVEVFSPQGVQLLHSGKTMLVRGTPSDPEYQIVNAPGEDDFDHWSDRRDHDLERSNAYRYVSRDVYGADDLDAYGSWVYTPEYGWVWMPRVAAGWAPYRHGRWSWVDWYGWTWVSYDPWGWAPFHYGRWFWGRGGWCWYPGGLVGRHYWSPALVAFFGFGGGGVGVGFGNVGWVPLAPYEPFHPWYGRGYYGGYGRAGYIDRSTYITNNINVTNIYRNARINNGITAVNAGDFSHGRFDRFANFSHDQLRQASLVRGPVPVVPGAESLRFSDRQVRNIPRDSGNARFFSMHKPAPVQRVSFAEQRRSLEQWHGGSVAGAATALHSGSTARVTQTAPRQAESAGWRRAGDNPRTGNAPGGQQGSTPGRSAAEATGGAGGWRRVGDSPNHSASPASDPATGRGSSGWSRFGAVDNRNRSAAPGTAGRAPQQQAPERGGWSRFGEPSSRIQAAPATRENFRAEPAARGVDQQSGAAGRGNRTEITPRAEQRSTSRFENRTPRQERIQVSPPVVRERPSAPAIQRGGSGSVGGGRVSRSETSVSRGSSGGSSRGGSSHGGRTR